MLAPVIIFVYARPDHVKKTIATLKKNYLVNKTEIFIYSDAAKNENTIEKVKLVREYLDLLLKKNPFKSIRIIKAITNKGLGNSVISGVTEIINQYGKVIVLEDDLVSSPDFLQYMNQALSYYEKAINIWSISGYTFKVKFPQDYKHDVYLSYRGGSWGWATWKDRWEKVDWEVSDYDQFKRDKVLRKRLNRGGRDMANMLDRQMEGKVDSWAIRWCFTQSKLDMMTVYPTVSRIRNIGLDGTGTHSSATSKFDVILNNGNNLCKFEIIKLDKRIVKSFQRQFGTSFNYFVFGVKAYIKGLLRLLHNESS